MIKKEIRIGMNVHYLLLDGLLYRRRWNIVNGYRQREEDKERRERGKGDKDEEGGRRGLG